MNISLVTTALRILSGLVPVAVNSGRGDRIAKTLDTIATLGDRGEEAYEELKALVEHLKTMEGVTPEEQEAQWAKVEDLHAQIQEAAKGL